MYNIITYDCISMLCASAFNCNMNQEGALWRLILHSYVNCWLYMCICDMNINRKPEIFNPWLPFPRWVGGRRGLGMLQGYIVCQICVVAMAAAAALRDGGVWRVPGAAWLLYRRHLCRRAQVRDHSHHICILNLGPNINVKLSEPHIYSYRYVCMRFCFKL